MSLRPTAQGDLCTGRTPDQRQLQSQGRSAPEALTHTPVASSVLSTLYLGFSSFLTSFLRRKAGPLRKLGTGRELVSFST